MIVNNHMMLHFCGVGLATEESKLMTRQVTKWIRCSGPEWTVNRFKDLKQYLKQRMHGEHPRVPAGFATRTNRKGEIIFRNQILQRVMTLPLNPDNIRFMEGFCRIYTNIKVSAMTATQRTKFLNNVEGEPCSSDDVIDEIGNSLTIRRLSSVQTETVMGTEINAQTLFQFMGTDKSAPSFLGCPADFAGTKNRVDDVSSVAFMDYLMTDTATNNLWKKYPQFFGERLVGLNELPYREAKHQMDLPAGKLSVIHEGGCKARWIANPAMLFQALGEPLKRKLQCYTQMKYPESAVNNQELGRQTAVNWLAEGRKVWGYDATAFTDRLPLRLQNLILRRLQVRGVISQQDYDALQIVMDKSWISDDLGRKIKWTVGQPLGYGPSFPLANLTHAMLLDTLDTKRTRLWKVLGDDVIIADEKLADRYYKTMISLGVEINLSKSFVSDEYGEFLGKLLTPTGVIPSGKASRIYHPAQLLNRFEWYGMNILKAVKQTGNSQFLYWSKMLFYPKDLGGVGLRLPNSTRAENIQLLDTKGIQQQRLNKDVRTFTSMDNSDADVDLGKHIELRNLFLSKNVSYILASGSKGSSFLNECHNIPAELLRTDSFTCQKDLKALRQPSWLTIVDNAITQEFLSKKRTIPRDLFQGRGFIHKTEKPFTNERPKCLIKERNHESEERTEVTKAIPKVFRNHREIRGIEVESGYQKAQTWSSWTRQTQSGSYNPAKSKRSSYGKVQSV